MSGRAEKWATGILGLVSIALLVNLLWPRGSRVGASHGASPAAPAPQGDGSKATPPKREFGDLGRYDPTVHLDALNKMREQPLPRLGRNPFEFPPERPPDREIAGVSGPGGGPGTPPAPRTPPVPLKALGFTERAGKPREAIVTDNDQIFIVHEGEIIARRFRVLSVSPTTVELQDDRTQQSIRLPINQ